MLNSHPVIRGIVYVAAVTATIASLVLGEIMPGEGVTRAVVLVADYLAGLAGMTALSHLSMNQPPLNKP